MVRREYAREQSINKPREKKYYFKKFQAARGLMKVHVLRVVIGHYSDSESQLKRSIYRALWSTIDLNR